MEPERPKLWPLMALIGVLAVNIVLVVTPHSVGGKPYGVTIAWALIVVFVAMLYRAMWAQFRAHQRTSSTDEEPKQRRRRQRGTDTRLGDDVSAAARPRRRG